MWCYKMCSYKRERERERSLFSSNCFICCVVCHVNASLSHLSICCVVCYTEHVLWLASDLLIHWSLCCCWVSTSRANGTIGCVLSQHNLFIPLCYRRSIHILLLLWSCTYNNNRMVIVELTSIDFSWHICA